MTAEGRKTDEVVWKASILSPYLLGVDSYKRKEKIYKMKIAFLFLWLRYRLYLLWLNVKVYISPNLFRQCEHSIDSGGGLSKVLIVAILFFNNIDYGTLLQKHGFVNIIDKENLHVSSATEFLSFFSDNIELVYEFKLHQKLQDVKTFFCVLILLSPTLFVQRYIFDKVSLKHLWFHMKHAKCHYVVVCPEPFTLGYSFLLKFPIDISSVVLKLVENQQIPFSNHDID